MRINAINAINHIIAPGALVGLEATALPPQPVGNAASLVRSLDLGGVEPVCTLYLTLGTIPCKVQPVQGRTKVPYIVVVQEMRRS